MNNKTLDDVTYGDLVLICGDIHIPLRKEIIPDKIKQFLNPNKIQHVICTGNYSDQRTYDWIQSLTNIKQNIHCVKGQYDDIPDVKLETKNFAIGQWKFALVHGHQTVPWGEEEALSTYGKENDADLVIYGQTHEARLSKIDKKYYLNPGSISGAYGPLAQEVVPEFVVLEIMGAELGIFIYHLINGELIIEKALIKK